MQVPHAPRESGPRPLRDQRPVDALPAPLGDGPAAPDARERRAGHQFQPSGADHGPVRFGHPEFHEVALVVQAPLEVGGGERHAERAFLRGGGTDQVGHRVGLIVDAPQGHAVREWDGRGEEARFPQHDGLRFLRLQAVSGEAIGQVGGQVVATGFPFEGRDGRLSGVVRDGPRDELVEGRAGEAAEVAVRDKAAFAVRSAPEGAVAGDIGSAGQFGPFAELRVVLGEELLRLLVAVTGRHRAG